jgi:hypothetical protein
LLWDFLSKYTLGCGVTSVTEERRDILITVYPNPVASTLRIDGIETQASFTILDLYGRSIAAGATTGSIDIGPLPSGSYVLTLQVGGEARSVRFVKE